MIKIDNKTTRKITFLLFLSYFLIGLFTFKDYGISIDEEHHRFAGFYWLNYVLDFTSFDELKRLVENKLNQIGGFTVISPADHPYYGVVFDLPVAFLEVIFGINDPKNYFHLKHLLNFILFFIGSIFFYKLLLDRFESYNISLIGTLFFVISPRIYGSSFFNNKDIIFLALVTITLYYSFKSIEKMNNKNLLIFAIFAALSTAHRILGIFLPISFIVFYILSNNKNLKNLFSIIYFIVIYFLFLIIFWPALWNNPIENLISAFQYFSDHPLKIQILFNGEFIYSNFLPYDYIFRWILITTPILYSVLFIFGYIQIFKRFFVRFVNIKENKCYDDLWRGKNEKKDFFILFNISSIVLYLIIFEIVLYNGWRHTYFINIFIIYIATYAFYKIDIYFKLKNFKNFHFITVFACLIFLIYKMIIFHPYQNIYFNNLFKKYVSEKFEVDYWGLSGKKSLEYILSLEKNNNLINIATAAYLPLERSVKLLDTKDREKIKVIGQNFQSSDYLFTNFISEVDKNIDDKYKIPDNFSKINEFILDDIRVYQIFKKNNK